MRSWTSPLFALLVSACASTGSVTPIGVTLDAESPGTPAPPAEAPKEIVPDDVVERAAQDFHARREADGQTLDQRQLFDELARYDVVCLGEAHDSARDHFAELAVVEALARRARVSGRALGVGFEMFQVPFEEALRSYARGRLDDAGLRKKTQYDDRWGFPYAYYRPVLAYAR
ncbi:MAG TPA: ChaN family lipoprotein, partial [Polyangiales bacterium]